MHRELKTLVSLVNAVRMIDSQMPLQTLSVFLEVARKEPVSMPELCKTLELAQSSVSRNLNALGEVHWLKPRPGLKLVELREDPSDARIKIAKLTSKGQLFLKQLIDIVGDRR